ncbi:LysR family transcriptional regulator [Microbacterium sp. A93]|uniref:LysR family transcriptional regulator n=1 Tax=Microbacterium sp. A93 TaxID=3450716 RepID=UPI003F426633
MELEAMLEAGPQLTLRQLELFVAATEHGSFTAAAQHAYVTPNAVSLAVGELERVLGVTLLVRHRARGVTTTPAGIQLVEGARALLRQAADLQLTVGDHGTNLSGPVALGCYSTLAATVVPELWERLAERHPEIELSITEGTTEDLVGQLHEGRLDCVIAYEVALPLGLAVRRLYGAPPSVVLPESHRLAGRAAVDLAELDGEPLVLFDLPPSGQNTLQLLRSRGIRPRVAHRTTNFELVHSLVGRGMGFAVQYQHSGVEVSREGRRLAFRPITPEPESEPVMVAWPERLPLTSRAAAVVRLAQDCLPVEETAG